jgi:hypothetical protein
MRYAWAAAFLTASRPSALPGVGRGSAGGRDAAGQLRGTGVIGKVTRGADPGGLLRYLYGPGRSNEHTDSHLVGGYYDPAYLEAGRYPDGSPDTRRLAGHLLVPLAARRPSCDKPVWHCSVRAAPGDRNLSDAEWATVAQEVMDRTGLAPVDDDEAVRWVAVRHAPDHIHIVATLARQDGARPNIWNDFFKVRAACQSAERRLGLQRTAPADRTAAKRPTRAETEQAARNGWAEPTRITLRREVSTAAAGASTEQEFFARLRDAGVLVRHRESTKTPGEITGYAVALPKHTTSTGGEVWFGGGKLAPDLTLPKLRRRWDRKPGTQPRNTAPRRITPADRRAAYEHAVRQSRTAADHIRHCAATDPVRAADAAWAAADTLHVAARMLRSPELRRAADAYDRAARAPHGRIPSRSGSGDQLRHCARFLGALGQRPGPLAATGLILSLAALAEAVTELRTAQHHAAQAAAARRAAGHLRAMTPARRPPGPAGPISARPSAAARLDFPAGLVLPRDPAPTDAAPSRPPRSSRPTPKRARPPPR